MNTATEKLQAQFPDAIVDIYEFRGDTTVTVKPDSASGDLCVFAR